MPVAAACPPQQFLHDGVLCGCPADTPIHGPEVDDVTDQVNPLGGMLAQEFKQPLGLTGARTEVDIRQEERSDLRHGGTINSRHEGLVTGVLHRG